MSTDQLKELEEALMKFQRKWIEADAVCEYCWDKAREEDPREIALDEAYRAMRDVQDQIYRLRYPTKEAGK